jgi:hypothetical protein
VTSRTFHTLANVAEALGSVLSPSLALGFAGIDGRTAPVLTAETVNLLAGHLARTTKRERNKLGAAVAIGIDRPGALGIATGPRSMEYPFVWRTEPLRLLPTDEIPVRALPRAADEIAAELVTRMLLRLRAAPS